MLAVAERFNAAACGAAESDALSTGSNPVSQPNDFGARRFTGGYSCERVRAHDPAAPSKQTRLRPGCQVQALATQQAGELAATAPAAESETGRTTMGCAPMRQQGSRVAVDASSDTCPTRPVPSLASFSCRVAQSVERHAVNVRVAGSSPAPAANSCPVAQSVEQAPDMCQVGSSILPGTTITSGAGARVASKTDAAGFNSWAGCQFCHGHISRRCSCAWCRKWRCWSCER